uniref:Proline dehydrogenase n=1 Tax=Acrobeloides nanus TaxID=290746 RepID=A0A914E6G6_9BILA
MPPPRQLAPKLIPLHKRLISHIFPETFAPQIRPPLESKKIYNDVDLTFENTQAAFKSKTNFALLRGLLVFRICSYDKLVQNNERLLHGMKKVCGKTLFKKILRLTFFGHFVGGENIPEVKPVMSNMARFGVKSILDYSAESDINHKTSNSTIVNDNESEFDKNSEIFCECIDVVATATDEPGLTAIKATALARPELLMRISENIAQVQNFFKTLTHSIPENLVYATILKDELIPRMEEKGIKVDHKLVSEWLSQSSTSDAHITFRDWNKILELSRNFSTMFQISSNGGGDNFEPLFYQLTPEENQEQENMMRRVQQVAEHAKSKNVRILVDAEQTYLQPAISQIAMNLMQKYNINEGCIRNTYQAYLKTTLLNLERDMDLAKQEGIHFGCKLVRGAYMNQERKRAKSMGYEDPINPTYEARNFLLCSVSFSLGDAGYSVYKYVPYGPIEEVLPYLSRRALENGGMLKKVQKERRLLWSEFKRRLGNGQFLYRIY